MAKTKRIAPEFSLLDPSGRVHRLSDYRGKWVILYFYPQDDTPGCTVEACSMRDARDDLAAEGAEVIGISMDNANSHEAFKSKYSLNFTLLTDPDAAIMKLYGAWGKRLFSKPGVLRKTFIIDPEGVIRKVYPRVIPAAHGTHVLEDLKTLKKHAI